MARKWVNELAQNFAYWFKQKLYGGCIEKQFTKVLMVMALDWVQL